MKKKLLISFSGGRTSAYMLWWLFNVWEHRHEWNMVVVFANTGLEEEGTLEFIEDCSQIWKIPIVWVEAKHKDNSGNWYSKMGWKVYHKIVTFETASRNGEPFEEMISCLGIPSTNAPFCSNQLKKIAIESYMKRIGWRNYYKAIGIRADEGDRMNPKYKELKILYPFIGNVAYGFIDTFKPEILSWWDNQLFNLEINSDFGNCVFCWKKDLPRLCRIALNHSEKTTWWQRMTDKYGQLNPRNSELKPPFNFFRGNISPNDILKIAQDNNKEVIEKMGIDKQLNGCEESCEAF